MQRVEPTSRVGLGRPVQRVLQGTDRMRGRTSPDSGTSHNGTHRAPPSQRHARTKQRPFPHRRLCCPAARPVLRPPPTPSRRVSTSRLRTGYRARPVHATAGRFGRGGPLQFPPPPSQRSASLTPGSPSRLPPGINTASMAFAVCCAARLSLRSNDAADFASRYGPLSCSPCRGIRRWASTRPVSRPSRQPATGLPGDYPDRTHTGRRRRASDQVTTAGRSPPDHWTHQRAGPEESRRRLEDLIGPPQLGRPQQRW
jgi:hypothetical protein